MVRVWDISSDPGAAIEAAVSAILDGDCIVLPTDTIYGIGADASSAPTRCSACWTLRSAAGTCRRRC